MQYLGFRLFHCPKCGEELIDNGYSKELKQYEKECPYCDLYFVRKKGYGHRWKMGTFLELY